jgi:23S rRNA pseudouridine2604 synthase
MLNDLTRLNKYISQSGLCSRREADRYIESGKVFINGKKVAIGEQVSPGDTVTVNGQTIPPRDEERLIFIALNKPIGIVSTTESTERSNIVDYINHSTRIFPIGRLDKDSQGLIFLTNNGDLVNKILRAGNNHEKEYLVVVDRPIKDGFIENMSKGVPILGVVTKGCKLVQESNHSFRITLIQGLNRQIRRMTEYFGYEVTQLTRQRIMNVSLKGLPVGDWRDLEPAEIKELLKLIEGSSSENHKKAKKKSTNKNKHSSFTKKTQKSGNKFDKRSVSKKVTRSRKKQSKR